MKLKKYILLAALISTITGTRSASAADKTAEKAKPYPLKTCVVSGEKFEGSEMKPYEFVHDGQTIKLCCKSCLKDFNKEPAKYLKTIEEAQKAKK